VKTSDFMLMKVYNRQLTDLSVKPTELFELFCLQTPTDI